MPAFCPGGVTGAGALIGAGSVLSSTAFKLSCEDQFKILNTPGL